MPPERSGAASRRGPTPHDWPELERIEHAVAWFDTDGRCLRDNSAFRRRRAGLEGLGWVLGAESRRAVLEAIRRVASGSEPSAAIEMAAPADRWELLAVHAVGDRPGTVLLELQDVTRRRLEERRLEAESAEFRAMVRRHGPTDRPSGTRRVPELPGLLRALMGERDDVAVVPAGDVDPGLLARGATVTSPSAAQSLAAQERVLIEQVLGQCHWHMKRAAATLGISRSTLYVKVRRHQIRCPEIRARGRRGSTGAEPPCGG